MATKYFRTDGNDANNGSADNAANAWLTPLPGCVGGAQICSSGDTIQTTQAGTFPLGANVAQLPAGVNLTGAGATTIITGTLTGALGMLLPIVRPGNGSTISNLKITSTVASQCCLGAAYLSPNYNGEVQTPVMSQDDGTFPAAFTCTNVTFDGFKGVIAFTTQVDTSDDGLSLLPYVKGTFNNCTITGKTWGTFIATLYSEAAAPPTNGTGDYVGSNITLEFFDSSITCAYTTGADAVVGAVRTTTGQVNLYNTPVSQTDTSTRNNTRTSAALYAGHRGRILMFGGSLTSSGSASGSVPYDIEVATTATTRGQIAVVGVDYTEAKVSGPNIIDVSVFPAVGDVEEGVAYGPNGDDLEGTYAPVLAGSPISYGITEKVNA